MEEPYSIHEQMQSDSFGSFRLYSMVSGNGSKLSLPESSFLKIYGAEAIRFYSKTGILWTHLMSLSGFQKWFDRKPKLSVYGSLAEGSFDIQMDSITLERLQVQFGPRQYFKSFSAFSVYAPVNYFQLSAPVLSFTCSENRLHQALDEARLDLKTGRAEQVLLLASNLSDRETADGNNEKEGLFYFVTDNQTMIQRLLKRLETSRSPENEIYGKPAFLWGGD